MPTSRRRRFAAALVLGALLATAAAAPASAETPVDLGASQLVDEAGVLDPSAETTLRDEIQSYDTAHGADLRVVFVKTFEDPSDRSGWARAVLDDADVTGGALVLAIAVQDRQYGFAANGDYPLDLATVQGVADDDLVPALRDAVGSGDWSGSVSPFIDGLSTASSGGSTGGGSPDGSTGDRGTSGASILPVLLGLAGLALLVLLVVAVVRRVRRRRAEAARTAEAAAAQQELDRTASRALVALDDELQTSEQELGFAQAEFGDGSTARFEAALADAKGMAQEAFRIRQRLDDADPETPEQRRDLTARIIELCEQAQQGLAAQSAAFDELRALEPSLPTAIPAAQQEQARLVGRRDRAKTAVDGLRSKYGDDAVRGVEEDRRQASDLVDLAGRALAEAEDDRSAGRPGEAAVALRGAQQALGQAANLIDGVIAAPEDFLAAQRRLDSAIDETRDDIAEAQRRSDTAETRQRLVSATSAAQAAIAAAPTQPLTAAITAVQAADAQLDQLLADLRDQDEQLRRAFAVLPDTIDRARDAVSSAARFVSSRRGGVGSEARTRLSEAQRQLHLAEDARESDPVAALDHARRAAQLAATAESLAQHDVDDWRNGGGWGGGGGYGGGGGGSF